jgi:putative SbcD/Mre11-related phosphoesterase
VLLPERLAVHLPSETCIVADLHLGYSQARQRCGDAVPLASLEAVLQPLATALTRREVRRLVVAGDLLEDGRVRSGEILAEFRDWLNRHAVDLVAVVPGNHDRGLPDSGSFPIFPAGYDLGDWRVMHGDQAKSNGKILQGHEHPALRWSERLTAPCFLVRPNRIILPAYSSDAAGVNVLTRPGWSNDRCFVIAEDQVLDFGVVEELREARSLRKPR